MPITGGIPNIVSAQHDIANWAEFDQKITLTCLQVTVNECIIHIYSTLDFSFLLALSNVTFNACTDECVI